MVSAIAVAFLGFFLGPLFPAGIVVSPKFLPKHLHLSAMGFAAAIGGTGGAIFLFAVGAIVQAKAVKVLQPVIMALLLSTSLLWLCRRGLRNESEMTSYMLPSPNQANKPS